MIIICYICVYMQYYDNKTMAKWAQNPVEFMRAMAWPGHVRSYQKRAFYDIIRYPRMIHRWSCGAGKRVFNAAYALWYASFHNDRTVLIIEPNEAKLVYSFGENRQQVEEHIAIMHGMFKSLPENDLEVNWCPDIARFSSNSSVEVTTADRICKATHLDRYDLVIINERPDNEECVDKLAPALLPYVASKDSRILISTVGGSRDGSATLAHLCATAIDVCSASCTTQDNMFHISNVKWMDVKKEEAAETGDDGMNVVRTRIDELDSTIVELLNRRAKYAVEIGKHKKQLGLPVCDAAREAFVLEKVAELANELRGPLDGESVKNIFRTIIEETRKAEE